MATKKDDYLLKEFSKASGSQSKADTSAISAGEASRLAPGQTVTRAFNAASGTVGAVPSYVGTSGSSRSTTQSGSSGGFLESAENTAKTFLESTLGVIPLVGSLFGLFGGGSSTKPVFQKYQKPASIGFSGATVGNSLVNADYDQLGMPRLYDTASPSAAPTAPASNSSPGSAPSGGSSSSPQISVNVQAMDARSFMDYSGQIAQAVRDAMLNLSSINDVVTEL
jgi:hypothetical protein